MCTDFSLMISTRGEISGGFGGMVDTDDAKFSSFWSFCDKDGSANFDKVFKGHRSGERKGREGGGGEATERGDVVGCNSNRNGPAQSQICPRPRKPHVLIPAEYRALTRELPPKGLEQRLSSRCSSSHAPLLPIALIASQGSRNPLLYAHRLQQSPQTKSLVCPRFA